MPDVILVYPRTLWDIKNVTTRLPLAALYIGSLLQAKAAIATGMVCLLSPFESIPHPRRGGAPACGPSSPGQRSGGCSCRRRG
mgnify:CR=1 FL=1